MEHNTNKTKEKKINKSIYFITLISIILLISIVTLTHTTLADENQDVMSTLYMFYQASVNNNLDLYMQVQDPLFLKMLEEDGTDPRTFYKAIFDEVDITSFSIENPEIILKEDKKSAIVYYELKGTYVLDGQEIKIDNDMVAFLWKYDDWKVRWTMTRGLYEDKIAVNLFSDLIVQEAVDEVDNTTLQQTFIQEGIPFELEPVVFEEEKDFSFIGLIKKIFFTGIIIFIILIIIVLLVVILKNKKTRTKIKHNAKITAKVIAKYSKIIFKLIIKYSIILFKLSIKILNLLFKLINKLLNMITHNNVKDNTDKKINNSSKTKKT